jgi:hypothetical protein
LKVCKNWPLGKKSTLHASQKLVNFRAGSQDDTNLFILGATMSDDIARGIIKVVVKKIRSV